jgi:hypothetical protein
MKSFFIVLIGIIIGFHLDKSEVICENDGTKFYENVKFDCGEGEVSSLVDMTTKEEVVPLGAVIHVAKNSYLIGSYEGQITLLNKKGEHKKTSKIFFSIRPYEKIEYFHPSECGKFCGEKINDKVSFY